VKNGGVKAAQQYTNTAGLGANKAGSLVTVNNTTFIVNNNNTMSPYLYPPLGVSILSAIQYALPEMFAPISTPGYVVNWGGSTYLINDNNTMSLCTAQLVEPDYNVDMTSEVPTGDIGPGGYATGEVATEPAPGATVEQVYQVPQGYEGTPAGYVVSYGGVNYITVGNATMRPYDGPVAGQP